MGKKYTNEINTLILISLLKQHGIRKIIASPGTTNITFVASVQQDDWFEVYSAFDERSAAFMANGLAEESGETVVLTCTGATASRNYLPGLTEAFYRKIPILAVTSTQSVGRVGQYVSQVIDRRTQFKDLVKFSVQLPSVYSDVEKECSIRKVNEAILEVRHGQYGPVHINLETTYSKIFDVENLPLYRKIERITMEDVFPPLPQGRIGIYIWSHLPFTDEEILAIENFCKNNNAVVICDLVSNYHGKYGFLATLPNSQSKDLGTNNFDLIINIGTVHGNAVPAWAKEQWRVNPDGIIRDRDYNLTKIFEMEEIQFFKSYSTEEKINIELYSHCISIYNSLLERIPNLPFSNMWVASVLSKRMPSESVLHLGILNSLRCWNYFALDSTINCYTNSGGYGIDGCLSSFIGACYENTGKECFLIIGDLSFFYDIDSLLNLIPNNAHILVVNNGIGTEFKNYNHPAAQFGKDADSYMAAKGHNGFKSTTLLKNLCIQRNIEYLSAESKDIFIQHCDKWIQRQERPILFEVFTNDKDESDAIRLMNNIEKSKSIKSILSKTIIGKWINGSIRLGK